MLTDIQERSQGDPRAIISELRVRRDSIQVLIAIRKDVIRSDTVRMDTRRTVLSTMALSIRHGSKPKDLRSTTMAATSSFKVNFGSGDSGSTFFSSHIFLEDSGAVAGAVAYAGTFVSYEPCRSLLCPFES